MIDKFFKPFFLVGSILCALTTLNWWFFSLISSYNLPTYIYYLAILICLIICCILNYLISKDNIDFNSLFKKNLLTYNFGFLVLILSNWFTELYDEFFFLFAGIILFNLICALPNIFITYTILYFHERLDDENEQLIDN